MIWYLVLDKFGKIPYRYLGTFSFILRNLPFGTSHIRNFSFLSQFVLDTFHAEHFLLLSILFVISILRFCQCSFLKLHVFHSYTFCFRTFLRLLTVAVFDVHPCNANTTTVLSRHGTTRQRSKVTLTGAQDQSNNPFKSIIKDDERQTTSSKQNVK